MKHPGDNPLQDLYPQVCHHKHPQINHLIKLTLILRHHPSMFLTATIDIPTQNPTAYPSMVQSSIIVAASAPTSSTSTSSLPSHITYSLTINITLVSYPDIPTRFPSTYPYLTPSLLRFTDTKEFPSNPPSSPPPPDTIQVLYTFPLSLTLGPALSSVNLFRPSNLPTPSPTS